MKPAKVNQKHPGSYQDPSGFIFTQNSTIYRQVNQVYQPEYDHLMGSGLYHALVDQNLLIPHTELDFSYRLTNDAHKVLQPEPIPFVSYPYEWSFSQLKAAALTTLAIAKKSLEFEMILKDASAFNIQFVGTRPVLIDTLSFELYQDGQLWTAYEQFCQQFLALLVLIKYVDPRLSQITKVFLGGIPLDLVSALLPMRTKFNFSLLAHLHFHAASQKRFGRQKEVSPRRKISKHSLLALIDNLESTVSGLNWQPKSSGWAGYRPEESYHQTALSQKKSLVSQFLRKFEPKLVWDLGANLGYFSRLASDAGAYVVAIDNDHLVVDQLYHQSRQKKRADLLPLVINLTNPSPDLGWAGQERESLIRRGPADTILALALVHHLVLVNNVPFDRLASFLGQTCHSLIIEFVPLADPQAQKLIAAQKNQAVNYSQKQFEDTFKKDFKIIKREKLKSSQRLIYLMTKA